MRIAGLAGKALPWTLAGIILLVPVLIVPNLASATFLPKFALLLLISPLALLFLLLAKINDANAARRLFRSPIVLIAFIWLLIGAASTAVAIEPQDALAGIGSPTVRSLFSGVALFALLFTVSHMSKLREQTILIRALVFAPLLPAILTTLGYLGLFPELFVEDGTVAGLFPDLVLLSVAGLVATLAATAVWTGRWRIAALVAAVFLLLFGALAFSQPAWLIVLIGGVFLLLVLLRNNFASSLRPTAILLPAFIVGFAALFAFGVTSPVRFAVPLQASPTLTTSVSIAKDVLSEDALLGVGPGQWSHAYAKYLPDEINGTPFWSIRFAAGSSELTTMPVERGVLGALAWLSLMGVLLYGLSKQLFKKAQPLPNPEVYVPAALFFVAVLAGQVTYFATALSIEPLFWVAAGILTALSAKSALGSREESDEATDTSQMSQAMLAIVAFTGIAVISAGVFGTTRLLASRQGALGLSALIERNAAEEATRHFASAVSLQRDNPVYWQRLADSLLTQLLSEAVEATDEDVSRLRQLAEDTQAATQVAVQLRPASPDVWVQHARIYQELFVYGFEDADRNALLAWDKAIELDPKHPGYLTERGLFRLKLLAASDATDIVLPLLEEARADFTQAIERKPDFAEAHFQLGVIASAAGNMEEAVSATETALQIDRTNVDYGLRLGLLYMTTEKEDDAVTIFEQILALEPQYASAHYHLALLLARADQVEQALEHIDWLIDNESEGDVDFLPRIRENIVLGLDPLEGLTEEENAELENLSGAEEEEDSGDASFEIPVLPIP